MVKVIWNKLTQSKENVFQGGLVLFLGMNLVNFGNYLFNLLMGRMLGPVDYGGLISLVSLLAIIGVPATTIQTSAMKFSAEFQAKNQTAKIAFLLRYLTKKIVMLAIILVIGLLIFSVPLSRFLNLHSSYPMIILSLASLFIFLLPINRGIIQGLEDFKGLSINMALEPLLKIIFAILLIMIGWKLNGAVLAIFLTSIVIYYWSFYPLKTIARTPATAFKTSKFWRYSLPALLGIFLINSLTYIDIIMVKHFLAPTEAGLYSALSTIAKIVLFFSFPFISAMFPKISNLYSRQEKHFPILAQTFIIVSLLSVSVMTFFMLFPSFSIKILFGQQYLAVSPYLGQLALAMFLLSLINVFVNYYLAIGQLRFIIFLALASVLEITLLTLFHSDFAQIIHNITITFAGLLLSLGLYYIYLKKEQISYVISHNSRL